MRGNRSWGQSEVWGVKKTKDAFSPVYLRHRVREPAERKGRCYYWEPRLSLPVCFLPDLYFPSTCLKTNKQTNNTKTSSENNCENIVVLTRGPAESSGTSMAHMKGQVGTKRCHTAHDMVSQDLCCAVWLESCPMRIPHRRPSWLQDNSLCAKLAGYSLLQIDFFFHIIYSDQGSSFLIPSQILLTHSQLCASLFYLFRKKQTPE